MAIFVFTLNLFKPTDNYVYVYNLICIQEVCNLPHTTCIGFV
jgi:hypothetical protein